MIKFPQFSKPRSGGKHILDFSVEPRLGTGPQYKAGKHEAMKATWPINMISGSGELLLILQKPNGGQPEKCVFRIRRPGKNTFGLHSKATRKSPGTRKVCIRCKASLAFTFGFVPKHTETSLPSLFWPTGCNQAAGAAAGNSTPALATTIEWKVAIQSRHVTHWPQISAVKLH